MSSAGSRWRPAYVGIGSNLDSPQDQVERAIDALAAIENTILVRTSPFYRSAPLDDSEQPDYINAVAALMTRLDAGSLLGSLQEIERAQGRTRGAEKLAPTHPRSRSVGVFQRLNRRKRPESASSGHWRTKFCIVALARYCAAFIHSGAG